MKRKLTILQEEAADCGVCSLLSIIRYYGGDIPLEQLRISSSTTKYGVTALNLIECAKSIGFDAKGIMVDTLSNHHFPCIAHLNINKSLSHFVVIYKVTDEYLIIMDPSVGLKRIELNTFNQLFTGILIELIPKTQIPKIKTNKIIEKTILKELKNNSKQLIFIVCLHILFVILSILSSTYMAFIENNIILTGIFFIILILITISINYSIEKYTYKLLNNIDYRVMKKFFSYILKLPLSYIQLKDKGEIIKRIEDVDLIKRLKINNIIKTILNIMIIIPTICILSYYLKHIWVIILIFVIIYLIINNKYHKLLNEYIDLDILGSTNYNNLLINAISGITSIKHSDSEDYFINNLSKIKDLSNQNTYKLNCLISKYQNINNGIIQTIEIILNIIIYINLSNNTLNIWHIFFTNILFGQLLSSLLSILGIIPSIKYKNKLVHKCDELLNLKIEESSKENFSNTSIKLKNVSYSYDNIRNHLQKININIKKGDKFLIIGPSGKGKSTIFKILMKELTNYKGSITVDNIELSSIASKEIKKNISYISQNETIFTGTIKENILLGKEVSDKKLDKIIKLCNLEELINKKPFGLDTFLIGGGEELSGGERQLIILARFLIRNKDILIIDEATSELSQNIEGKVLKNIMKYYKDKTIIFVTHKHKRYLFKKVIELY